MDMRIASVFENYTTDAQTAGAFDFYDIGDDIGDLFDVVDALNGL